MENSDEKKRIVLVYTINKILVILLLTWSLPIIFWLSQTSPNSWAHDEIVTFKAYLIILFLTPMMVVFLLGEFTIY